MAALLLMFSTARISIIEGRSWKEQGDSTRLKFVDIEPERGNIYSADGRLLATSVPFFDLHVDLGSEAMTNSIFSAHVDSLAECLARDVFKHESTDNVKRRLLRAREAGHRYFLIKRNATYAELSEIREYPLFRLGKYQGGLIIERKSSRMKPFQNLASRTIGLDREFAPNVGLEGSFDEYLKGSAGKMLKQRVSSGVWIPVNDLSEIHPERGKDIVTTLDMRMQDICETELRESLVKHDADFGLVVMMEVETGAIRAMVNLDRNKDGTFEEKYNHAVADATEPGSTFKLASVMALLEDGFIDVEDSVAINHGKAFFGKFKMEDSHWRKEKRVTIKHAFEISSNVGIARVVDDYYGVSDNGSMFIDRLRQFGLNEITGIEIQGEGTPNIKDMDHELWNRTMTLPWMAHGYELEVTPVQTLTFYNAIANNGKKMKPYLVDKVVQGTKVIEEFEPTVLKGKIASKQTIRTARELLEGVVHQGTASQLKSSEYSFAGKSGTTKLEYWTGSNKYQASFVGYFPAENPRYSCIVMVNNPRQQGFYGSLVSGAIFKDIADKCMGTDVALMKVKTDIPQEPLTYPVFEAGYTPDLLKVLQGVKLNYENKADSDWCVLMPGENGVSVENRRLDENVIPNVVGMGLRDAVFILENMGLKVKINGSGRVRDQSIQPGTRLEGQKILLYLG